MIVSQEKHVEKIKNAADTKSVESIIENFLLEMKKKGEEDYRIAIFIRKLDISLLMLERKKLTDKQKDNVKYAQKILINKIIHGSTHDIKKKIK